MIPPSPEIDLDKQIDKRGYEYIGKASLAPQQLPIFDDEPVKYRCLAKIYGMLLLVELNVTRPQESQT